MAHIPHTHISDSSSLCFLIHDSMPRQAGSHLPILCRENSTWTGTATGRRPGLTWSTPLSCSNANVHHEFSCSWHVKDDSNILVKNTIPGPETPPPKKTETEKEREKQAARLLVDVTKEQPWEMALARKLESPLFNFSRNSQARFRSRSYVASDLLVMPLNLFVPLWTAHLAWTNGRQLQSAAAL